MFAGGQSCLVSVLGVETGTFAYALAAAAGLTGLVAASEVALAGGVYIGLGVRATQG